MDAAGANPPRVVDPRNNAEYVLVPLTEYEEVRKIVEDERRQQAIRAPAVIHGIGSGPGSGSGFGSELSLVQVH